MHFNSYKKKSLLLELIVFLWLYKCMSETKDLKHLWNLTGLRCKIWPAFLSEGEHPALLADVGKVGVVSFSFFMQIQ